jgi:hypothetical protein
VKSRSNTISFGRAPSSNDEGGVMLLLDSTAGAPLLRFLTIVASKTRRRASIERRDVLYVFLKSFQVPMILSSLLEGRVNESTSQPIRQGEAPLNLRLCRDSWASV